MSQCQMCGREIPDGQQLCSICRNAVEWQRRQQQVSGGPDRQPGGGGQSAPEMKSRTTQSRGGIGAKGTKTPGTSKAPKGAKSAPTAKAPQPGRLPAVILGAVLAAFLLFFAAAFLFGSRSGSAGGTAPTLEPWQGDSGTVQTVDPGPEQVVAAAPKQTLPQQQPTEPQQPVEGQQTAEDGEYIFPNSDSAYLTREQVAALTPEQLRLARNEIYARHGRIFQDETLAAYFGSKSWYQPLYDGASFDALGDSILNEYEIANRDLIQEYEALYNGQ